MAHIHIFGFEMPWFLIMIYGTLFKNKSLRTSIHTLLNLEVSHISPSYSSAEFIKHFPKRLFKVYKMIKQPK